MTLQYKTLLLTVWLSQKSPPRKNICFTELKWRSRKDSRCVWSFDVLIKLSPTKFFLKLQDHVTKIVTQNFLSCCFKWVHDFVLGAVMSVPGWRLLGSSGLDVTGWPKASLQTRSRTWLSWHDAYVPFARTDFPICLPGFPPVCQNEIWIKENIPCLGWLTNVSTHGLWYNWSFGCVSVCLLLLW